MQDSLGVVSVTWIFDKAHFHLDDYVDKQNDIQPQSSRLTIANPPHPELLYGVQFRALKYSVPFSSMVQSLLFASVY